MRSRGDDGRDLIYQNIDTTNIYVWRGNKRKLYCDEYTNSYPSIRTGNYLQTTSDYEIDRTQIRVEATVCPLWCDAVTKTNISSYRARACRGAVLSPNHKPGLDLAQIKLSISVGLTI